MSKRLIKDTVWKCEKFGLIEKIFRQINSLVICLVKPLLSRNFCRKSVRLKFYNFHTVETHVKAREVDSRAYLKSVKSSF